MRLAAFIKQDLRFQFNNNFQFIYLGFVIVYSSILSAIPGQVAKEILPALIFSEPGILSYFFIGAIVMFEKEQGILQSVFITPGRFWEYAIGKIISLGLAACVGTGIILFSSNYFNSMAGWILINVFLSNCFFTALGFILAVAFKEILHYLIIGGLTLSIFVLPIFEYYQAFDLPFFQIVPSYQMFSNLHNLVNGNSNSVLLNLLIIAIWSMGLFVIAQKAVQNYVKGVN